MTRPIIESSHGMRFGCFQYNYPELLDQFSKSKLQPFTNDWSQIHDFNAHEGNNLSYLTEENLNSMQPFLKELPDKFLSKDEKPLIYSCIPYTFGNRKGRKWEKSMFVMFIDTAIGIVLEFADTVNVKVF